MTRFTSFGRERLSAPVCRAGGLCLWVSAGVHLWLYNSAGYSHIPTIGQLFIVQGIVSILLATIQAFSCRAVVAIGSGLFLLSVLTGYALSVTVALFGFRETGQIGAAILAGSAEAIGGLMLLGLGLRSARRFLANPTSGN